MNKYFLLLLLIGLVSGTCTTKGSTGTIKPTTVKNGGVGGGSGVDNTGQSGTGTGGTGNGKVTTSARRRRRQATTAPTQTTTQEDCNLASFSKHCMFVLIISPMLITLL